VLVGAFVAALTLGSNPFGVAAGIACGNTVEAVLGAWALRRLDVCGEIASLKDAAALLGVALLAPLASMVTNFVTLSWAGTLPWSNFAVAGLYWWLAHALGTFIVLPPLLAWAGQPVRNAYVRRRLEFAGATVLIVALTSLAYWYGGALRTVGVPFLPPAIFLFPPIVWALMRLRPRATSVVMAAGFTLTVVFALAGGATGTMGPLIFLALVLLIVGGGWLLLFGVIAERTRTSQTLQQTLGRLMEAQRIGQIGDWEFDLVAQEISGSPQVFAIMGRDPQLGPPRDFAEAFEMYDPASRALVAETVARAIASGEPQEQELVALRPNGQRVDVQARAVPRKDASGRVVALFGTVQDITERKLAEAALRASEKTLSAVLEHMSEGVMIADAERNVIYQNPASLRIVGFEPNEIGRIKSENISTDFQAWDEQGNPLDAEAWPISRVVRGERVQNQVLRVRRIETGHEWIANYNGSPIYADDGRFDVSFITIHDITERRRTEMALQESHSLLQTAGRVAHFGGWSVNLADGQQTWSDEVARIHDETPGFVPSVTDGINYYAPEWRERISAVFGQCVQHGTPYDEEMQIVTARGRRVWVRAVGEAVRDAEGQIVRVQGAFQNIDERKNAELQLQEREEQLRLFVKHSPAAIAMLDQHMRYIVVSDRWLSDYGLAERNIIGIDHYELFPDLPDHWKKAHRRCLEGAIERSDAEEFVHPDGSSGWVRWELRPWRKPDGEIGGLIFFTEIVTERVRAGQEIRHLTSTLEQRVIERTAELQSANAKLQAFSVTVSNALRVAEGAEKAKTRFLATMSHELRTPLNSIIGFTDIILEGLAGPLNPEQAKQLAIVQGSARHLLALINDLLDISKIEAGKVEVRSELIDLRAIIERVIASIKPLADKKGLTLRAVLSPTLNTIVSDRLRVEQILLNLLSNAVKFTDSGGVTLTVEKVIGPEAALGSASRPAACFRVTDSGIGVNPDDLSTLFQPFRQAESGRARSGEGTGLGLAISRRLAMLLGGEIFAESELAKGSTFTFTLPLVEAVGESPLPPLRGDLSR
jgi:PAS domain S-box-containing protein